MSNQRKDIHNSDIPEICISCEARHGGICAALNPQQLSELSKYTRRTSHTANSEFQSEIDDQQNYANILSGVVKLTKLMSDGRQQIVGLQFAPDFLGRPFQTQATNSVQAATDIKICSFPKSVLESLIEKSPELEFALHKQHMRELDEARDWLLALGRKTAIEKVASFLLFIIMHSDPEKVEELKEIRIALPLKRDEIADFLGLTVETVSRQLTNLRKKSVIKIKDRKSIIIIDLKKLKQIAQSEV